MAALPLLSCWTCFSNNPFNTSPGWTDVSADLIMFSTKRGRQYQLDRFQAGTATVLLNNSSGNYWPKNAGGPYYPYLGVRNLITLRATYGYQYSLYTGFVRQWLPVWQEVKNLTVPCMQLDIADGIRGLSGLTLPAGTSYSQELSGARIGHVLDTSGWPSAWRVLAAGQKQMQASGTLNNTNAMDHINSVQDSENGICWVRADGNIIFQDSTTRLQAPYTTSQATFGDGNLPMYMPEPPLDDDLIYNDVQITNVGGTLQEVGNSPSQQQYGASSLSLTSLLLSTDADALSLAQYLLSRYYVPMTRLKSMTVKPQAPGYETLLWPQALGREISDRITVIRNEAGINGDYYIEGVNHDWDYRTGEWTTSYMLSDVEAAAVYWVLGQAGNSELGITTRLWW